MEHNLTGWMLIQFYGLSESLVLRTKDFCCVSCYCSLRLHPNTNQRVIVSLIDVFTSIQVLESATFRYVLTLYPNRCGESTNCTMIAVQLTLKVLLMSIIMMMIPEDTSGHTSQILVLLYELENLPSGYRLL